MRSTPSQHIHTWRYTCTYTSIDNNKTQNLVTKQNIPNAVNLYLGILV